MRDDLQTEQGFSLIAAVFGFCGGVLSLSHAKYLTVKLAFFSVLSGIVCATAFTPWMMDKFDFPEKALPAVALLVGLCAIELIGRIRIICLRIQILPSLQHFLERWSSNHKDEP